jgi:CheY-like chemotaxis protein
MLGHTVTAVERAENIEPVFSSFEPDVTLVDYMLPGRSGLDLLKELSGSHPDSIRFLATGMGDFKLLEEALDAGATSMLCKPYRMTDMMALIDMATLLDAALKTESDPRPNGDAAISLHCSPTGRVSTDDLGALINFARAHRTDEAIAARRLPLIAYELMKNAATHGSGPESTGFSVHLQNTEDYLDLIVSDHGPGFDHSKVLARAHAVMDKSRASGLQIVLAAADRLDFTDSGRIAHARIVKYTGPNA